MEQKGDTTDHTSHGCWASKWCPYMITILNIDPGIKELTSTPWYYHLGSS